MTTFLATLIWLGGVHGAIDAGHGLWRSWFWPFYFTRQLVRSAAASGKESHHG